MIRKVSAAALLFVSALLLASCSGVPGGGCVVNCGGGTATVSVVLTANPPNPADLLSIQDFSATIAGLTLGSSANPTVNIPLNTTSYIADFTRVTSDSTLLAAKATIPADTYTTMTVTFSAPKLTYCTQANSGTPGCTNGTLTVLSGTAGSATVSINLTINANQQTGIALNADIGSTLTLSGQTVTAINLGTGGVFSVALLPPLSTATDLAATQLSHVDDVLGTVASVSGSIVTLQTTTRGSIVATADASTQFSIRCPAAQDITCVIAGQVAVIDTILNADGTIALTFFEPLLPSSFDMIEGVVTSVPDSVSQTFTMVATDTVFASTGSLISGQVSLGDPINVSLVNPSSLPFIVVSKGLTVPANNFEGSTGVSTVLPGQTVAMPVSAFTALSGSTPAAVTTASLALRFTRVTGVASAVSSPLFTGTAFPGFLGIATPQSFQTTSGRLSLDGFTNLASLPIGNTFSSSTLFLGTTSTPAFSAQSIRTH